jgi:hypothetical protein
MKGHLVLLGILVLVLTQGAVGRVDSVAHVIDNGPGGTKNASAEQALKPVPKPPLASYKQAVMASRPVAYWRLDEPKGSLTAIDATGNKHNGTYHNKPHLGEPGALAVDKDTAIRLDGPKSKSYVEVPPDKVFGVATSGKGLTIEAWMRPDMLDFRGENQEPKNSYIHWLGRGEQGQYEWGFRFYNSLAERRNRISAYIWNPEGGEGAGAYFQDELRIHEWIYIVATFDDPKVANARVQIYKNGAPSKHSSSPGTLYETYGIKPTGGKAPVRLGSRDLRGFLTGGLDEVAIYPRVLTPDEIRRHWVIGSGTRAPKLTRLDWALMLVNGLAPENTSYRHKNISVKWKGIDGAADYESHADCSGFINALLKRADGLTDDTFELWLGIRRPLAKTYHDAITNQNKFKRVVLLKDAQPGDVIAVKYRPGDPENTDNNTGHILLMANAPQPRKATAPLIPGTAQWEVTVIDQSRSGHGKTDTRHQPDGKFVSGLGQGVLRLYTDNSGKVVGYSWSTFATSEFHDQTDRHLVIGRPQMKPK